MIATWITVPYDHFHLVFLQVAAAPSAPVAKTPRSSGKKPARKPVSAKKSTGKKPSATKARVSTRAAAAKAPAAVVASGSTPGNKGIAGTVYNAAAAFLTGLKRRLSTA